MELLDIYDNDGCKTGIIKKRTDILKKGEYRLAAEVWIINSKCEILIQQRSSNKDILPNIWGSTTGCIISGEDKLDGAIREVKEEIGISIAKNDLDFIRRIFRQDMIWDIYFVYEDVDLSKVVLQTEEVSAVKFVSIQEFRDMLSIGEIFEYPEIYDILALIKQ